MSGSTPLAAGVLVVNHRMGSSSVSAFNGSGWNSLGVYPFDAGALGSVVASDGFASTSAFGVADAVMFRYRANPPVITLQPQSITVVEGTDAMLYLEAAGNDPLGCQWQFNGENLPGAFGRTLFLPAVNRSQAGRYRALLSNTDGAVMSREVELNVVAPFLRSGLQGGVLVLDWDGAATVQTATNAAGPYFDLPGASAPFIVQPTNAQQFFRLSR
jgi:Immunoglobulin domain